MFTESIIEQFLVKVRLQAVIEGIDEKAALACTAARLRLATGEITKSEYYQIIDEINHVFVIIPESENDKFLELNRWLEQQINDLNIAPELS